MLIVCATLNFVFLIYFLIMSLHTFTIPRSIPIPKVINFKYKSYTFFVDKENHIIGFICRQKIKGDLV